MHEMSILQAEDSVKSNASEAVWNVGWDSSGARFCHPCRLPGRSQDFSQPTLILEKKRLPGRLLCQNLALKMSTGAILEKKRLPGRLTFPKSRSRVAFGSFLEK